MKTLLVVFILVCTFMVSVDVLGQAPCRPDSPKGLRECILTTCTIQDWDFFMSLCDSKNVGFQKDLGVGQYQYIAEALGLHSVNNSLEGDIAKKSTLDQVSRISLRGTPRSNTDGTITFIGTATLKDGKQLRVQVHARRIGGYYKITPALG